MTNLIPMYRSRAPYDPIPDYVPPPLAAHDVIAVDVPVMPWWGVMCVVLAIVAPLGVVLALFG